MTRLIKTTLTAIGLAAGVALGAPAAAQTPGGTGTGAITGPSGSTAGGAEGMIGSGPQETGRTSESTVGDLGGRAGRSMGDPDRGPAHAPGGRPQTAETQGSHGGVPIGVIGRDLDDRNVVWWWVLPLALVAIAGAVALGVWLWRTMAHSARGRRPTG